MAGEKLIYGKGGIHGLSYSRLQDLYGCPRKFQLIYQLNAKGNVDEQSRNVNFAFGHAVGAGIQSLLEQPKNLNRAVVHAFARWNISLLEEDPKKKKSVWFAIKAIRSFYALLSSTSALGRKYRIATFTDKNGNQKPAIELHFKIELSDGFTYEGHVDAILQEIGTNNFVVLELKTSSFNNIHDAVFKNSMQATGYSLVMDAISPNSAQYVFYLIYKSGAMEFEEKVFPKNVRNKLNLLSILLSDVEMIQMYDKNGFWPMRGNNCFNFFSPCEYFGVCEMSDETLRREPEAEQASIEVKEVEYDFEFDLLTSLDALSQIINRTHKPKEI